MDVPENHTLHLLREMREEIRGVDGKVEGLARKVESLDRKVESLDRKVESLDRKVDRNHLELKNSIEDLRRHAEGESVLGRFAAAHVDSRLESLERRVSTLEQPG